jgi:integrase
VQDLFADPTCYRRTLAASRERGWAANGVSLASVVDALAKAGEGDVAVCLLLQRAFGLRVRESLFLRPHEADAGDRLLITRGAKNGRSREVPIEHSEQRQVLELAKAFAAHPSASMMPGHLRATQAYKRYFRVLADVAGVSRACLGVTSHGLRHDYAADRYQAMAGLEPPLRRLAALSAQERERDRAARRSVSELLGHNRPAVTSAYLGPVRARAMQGEGRVRSA